MSKNTLVAINIRWDIEEYDVRLPMEIEIPAGMDDPDEISDYLSDVSGFCHDGFDLVCKDTFEPVNYDF